MIRHVILRRMLVSTLALILLAAATILTYAMHIRNTTAKFIHEISALRVGESRFSDLERVIRSFRQYQLYISGGSMNSSRGMVPDGTPCTANGCDVAFRITNGVLGKFNVLPGAEFRAVIVVRQDRVIAVSLLLHRELAAFVEDDEILPTKVATPPYALHFLTGGPGFLVQLNSAATPVQRRNHTT